MRAAEVHTSHGDGAASGGRSPRRPRGGHSLPSVPTVALAVNNSAEFTDEGTYLTRLIMQDWARALTTEIVHYSSFSVYGQVKWREAIVATAALGRPNFFLSQTAFFFLSMSLDGFGKYKDVMGLLLDKLAECSLANYSQISTPVPETFFTGMTNPEYMQYLMKCIEKLKIECAENEIWKEQARQERVRFENRFKGVVKVWHRGMLGVAFTNWSKWNMIHKKHLKRLMCILSLDSHDRHLDRVWYYFNQWTRCVTHRVKGRLEHSATDAWETFRQGIKDNVQLNEHVHHLKVEAQSLEKKLGKVRENIVQANIKLRQLTEDHDAMVARETFWEGHATVWAAAVRQAIGGVVEGHFQSVFLRGTTLGIELLSPPSEADYAGVIRPIEERVGLTDCVRETLTKSELCIDVLKGEKGRGWLKGRASTVAPDQLEMADLMRAFPGLPPVVEDAWEVRPVREALDMVEKVVFGEGAFPLYITAQDAAGKGKEKPLDQWQYVAQCDTALRSRCGEESSLADSIDAKWVALKNLQRGVERDVWEKMGERVAEARETAKAAREKAEEEKDAVETEESRNVRKIAEGRFAKLNGVRVKEFMRKRAQQRKYLMEDVDGELEAVVDVLKRFVYDTKDAFKIYTGTDSGLSSGEFVKFCKDCKICGKKGVKVNDVGRLFTAINLNSDDADGVDREMDSGEFVESLLHLAGLKYKGEEHLATCVTLLFEDCIRPHADKIDLDTFKAEINNNKIKAIVRPYRGFLRNNFKKFSDADDSQQSSNAMDSMSPKEFGIFAKAMNLMRGRLSMTDVEALFMRVQENDGSDDEEEEQEMIYGEFEEGVLALVHYEFPSPYIPYTVRLSRFLEEMKNGKIGKETVFSMIGKS